jgi:hypothetical protein
MSFSMAKVMTATAPLTVYYAGQTMILEYLYAGRTLSESNEFGREERKKYQSLAKNDTDAAFWRMKQSQAETEDEREDCATKVAEARQLSETILEDLNLFLAGEIVPRIESWDVVFGELPKEILELLAKKHKIMNPAPEDIIPLDVQLVADITPLTVLEAIKKAMDGLTQVPKPKEPPLKPS